MLPTDVGADYPGDPAQPFPWQEPDDGLNVPRMSMAQCLRAVAAVWREEGNEVAAANWERAAREEEERCKG